MTRFNTRPTQAEIDKGINDLAENEYPGRLLIQGKSLAGLAVQAYALTGRSESSRNRVIVPDDWQTSYLPGGGEATDFYSVRVVAPGMSKEQMAQVENAALIYYKAMYDSDDGIYVVSNGAQTEPVTHAMSWQSGNSPKLLDAVKSAPKVVVGSGDTIDLSQYEPDSPNFTPRITGAFVDEAGPTDVNRSYFEWATVRKSKTEPARPIYSSYRAASSTLEPGVGFGIQTYNGNGNPLPSFDRQPYPFPLGETPAEIAHSIWSVLNQDNRVAVVVRAIDDYGNMDYEIKNKLEH